MKIWYSVVVAVFAVAANFGSFVEGGSGVRGGGTNNNKADGSPIAVSRSSTEEQQIKVYHTQDGHETIETNDVKVQVYRNEYGEDVIDIEPTSYSPAKQLVTGCGNFEFHVDCTHSDASDTGTTAKVSYEVYSDVNLRNFVTSGEITNGFCQNGSQVIRVDGNNCNVDEIRLTIDDSDDPVFIDYISLYKDGTELSNPKWGSNEGSYGVCLSTNPNVYTQMGWADLMAPIFNGGKCASMILFDYNSHAV